MRLLITLFICFLLISCSSSKKQLLGTIEQYADKSNSTDSILLSIQKSNDLVIGYATVGTAWSYDTYYSLLALKGKRWKAYTYVKQSSFSVSEKRYTLDSLLAPDAYGDSVVSALQKAKGWELMNEKKNMLPGECPHLKKMCMIYDAENQYLIIITRNYQSQVKFYAPEYFENECCPGWDLRQRFLMATAPIKRFFRKP